MSKSLSLNTVRGSAQIILNSSSNEIRIYYEDGFINVYCAKCGAILYSKNLKELRK